MHRINSTTMAFFNNQMAGGGSFGRVIELDHDNNSAEFTLSVALPQTAVLGDAQFLSNGNLLFTAGVARSIQEVTPSGDPVQTLTLPGVGVGFAEHRRTLYGAPPR
jgi:hypothetical protein